MTHPDPRKAFPCPLLDALEDLNARLDPHDLMVGQLDNGRWVLQRILRGAVDVGYARRYDGYRRIGKSYATFEEARAAAERKAAGKQMTEQELARLREEYPELPAWITKREGMTLAQARELMELRRRAFPLTRPVPKQRG
jgi:hypothetical protein